jgi:Fic family protein
MKALEIEEFEVNFTILKFMMKTDYPDEEVINEARRIYRKLSKKYGKYKVEEWMEIQELDTLKAEWINEEHADCSSTEDFVSGKPVRFTQQQARDYTNLSSSANISHRQSNRNTPLQSEFEDNEIEINRKYLDCSISI